MKRLLLLIMCLATLTMASAQKPLSLLGKSVQYVGAAANKLPAGEGTITINSGKYNYTLQGTFFESTLESGKLYMEKQDVTFNGKITYAINKKLKAVVVTMSNGEFKKGSTKLFTLKPEEQLTVTIHTKSTDLSGSGKFAVEYNFDAKDIEMAKRFAGEESYTNYAGLITLTATTDNGIEVSGWEELTSGKMTFANGAEVIISKDGNSSWKRANGDRIDVEAGVVTSYNLAINQGRVSNENIDYTFANGNKYVGSHKDLVAATLDKLITLNSVEWAWDIASKNIVSGVISYTNGNTIVTEASDVVDFTINFDNCSVTPHRIVYTFANGAKYDGTYKSLVPVTLAELMKFNSLTWAWGENLKNNTDAGVLTFENGNTIRYEASEVSGFDMAIEAGHISSNTITYTFPSGEKYMGRYNENLAAVVAGMLLNIDEFSWSADKFDEWIAAGTLTLTNGTVAQVEQGMKPKLTSDVKFEGGSYKAKAQKYAYANDNIKVKATVELTNNTLFNFDSLVTRDNLLNVIGSGELELANGEHFEFSNGELVDYLVIYDGGTIQNGTITHTFDNGNKYVGKVNGLLDSAEAVLSFKSSSWRWADFDKHVADGTLTLADGTRKNYVKGAEVVKGKRK